VKPQDIPEKFWYMTDAYLWQLNQKGYQVSCFFFAVFFWLSFGCFCKVLHSTQQQINKSQILVCSTCISS